MALLISCLLSWISYKTIIAGSRKYVLAVRHNERLFRHNDKPLDILLLGTSRMKNHLDPHIIDSITGLCSFNAGIGGCTAVEANMILKTYLLRNKPPKTIFITADVIFICSTRLLTLPAAYLTCDDLPPVREMLGRCGMPVKLYDIIPFLKVTEMDDIHRASIFYMVKNWIKPSKLDLSDSSGFINTINSTLKEDNAKNTKIATLNNNCVDALDEIIAQCRKNNIQLVFLHAPEFKHIYSARIANLDKVMNVYYSRCKAYNIPYLHYDSLSICSMPQYFRDYSHLNAIGARVYSTIFAQDLLQNGILKTKY
ncbi:MAG: hypothetical protein JST82_16725 [Bacteroidetes bacterium]|nr:hypothetical protein [Bacteroidota bacterium]